MHSLAGHVDQEVFAMRLGIVAISDFEDDSASFFLDMVEQILGRLEHIEEKVDRLFFLDAVEYGK